MKKIILLYLTLLNIAFAYNYDDVLLKAQASIFPKIMLLDKKVEDKLIRGEIVYTIVYDKYDYNKALEVGGYINETYKGYFHKYKYKINFVDVLELSDKTEASAIYVLNVEKETQKVADIAKKKGVISFSYDIGNLKNGLMFSLVIEKSTVLYLKKENLYNQKVEFVDSLLQIVRFTESDNIKNKVLLNNGSEFDIKYAKTVIDIFYN
ncbi:MAG: hypothetical protein A2513_00360 [Sulfurimonas sp. RIFOXYD12_FULL_33_39]|uniref:hypothetical protein n=1 Tax=unclassified Sulfurimonas TaxID=2623549 RepID=UPI0008C6E018|nr:MULTISPECIES: hypothetical protein [unclassified Sulfurimonas]OHE04766.1 MAG: hypothetical protein A3G74_00130 [Sulfurimonas sp. RIFCSPLOWO2_12_FULL_34_6]OHE10781.1 MAG: hypothetical protein A2513_00360 [Sulfurimonas sp. RIFOXYD12_FULL_33_39]OHE13449.1 MAG: hypothetical protein A2530_07820 [Sulfurimonas sp. RIFOXYD2_FULL_34_21]